jgi:lysozyme
MPTQPVLKNGATGEAVERLQRALSAAGHATHRLQADGLVGPATWRALSDGGAGGGGGGCRLSTKGAAFIAHFEGLKTNLYNDPVGHCTIGCGHLVHHGPINGSEPEEFRRGITRERAFQLLQEDASTAAHEIAGSVKVHLSQPQVDALISFAFNVGTGAFRNSTLLRLLNQGDYASVPAQLDRWTKASGKALPGLVLRRKAEGELFRDGNYVE